MDKDQDNRDHPFYRVLDFLVTVSKRPGSYLSTDDLYSLGIKLSDMDINTGKPADDGPQFCDLYTKQAFDDLFENAEFEEINYWPTARSEGNGYYLAYAVGSNLVNCLGVSYSPECLLSKSKYLIRG